MGRMVPYEFLLLVFVTFISSIVSKELSPGAKKCFNDKMVGIKRRVKLEYCNTNGTHLEQKGYPFSNLEIRVGNVLFNTRPDILRTALMKNTQVQICMYGELDTNRLRESARLQISAHGKLERLPDTPLLGEVIANLNIDASFCDLEPNGCKTTEPVCSERAPGGGIQEFCSCATLKVPAYAPAGADVLVTWKLLEIPSDEDPDVCEEDFKIDDLFNNKKKETLACLKIPARVQKCKDISEGNRQKIIGCKRN